MRNQVLHSHSFAEAHPRGPGREAEVLDEDLLRLQFRYVALEAHAQELRERLEEEGALRQALATLEAHAEQLAADLRNERAERERLVAVLLDAADLNRRSLAQIMELEPQRLRTFARLAET